MTFSDISQIARRLEEGPYIERGFSLLSSIGEFDNFARLHSVVAHICIMLWYQNGISMEILVSPDGH